MGTEKFCAMPYPKTEYNEWMRHSYAILLESEGKLAFCCVYGSSFWVWVWEDYQDRIWVKRHLVHLDLTGKRYLFMRDCFSGKDRNIDITLVDIQGNEMLFDWGARGLYIQL